MRRNAWAHSVRVRVAYLQAVYFEVDITPSDPVNPESEDNVLGYALTDHYSENRPGTYLQDVYDPVTGEYIPPPTADGDLIAQGSGLGVA